MISFQFIPITNAPIGTKILIAINLSDLFLLKEFWQLEDEKFSIY